MSVTVPDAAGTPVVLSLSTWDPSIPWDPEIPWGYVPANAASAAIMPLLAPWLTLHLAWVIDAIGAMFSETFDLAAEVGDDDGHTPTIGTYDQHGTLVTDGYSPPYGALFDPSRCKASRLPFLGQFVGVRIPEGADETSARAILLEEAGFKRGGPSAIMAAARRFLAGARYVDLLERIRPDGVADVDWFVLVVHTAEVIDVDGLIAAVDAAKPGGTLWELVQTDGWTISEMEASYASLTLLEAAFPSITNLEENLT